MNVVPPSGDRVIVNDVRRFVFDLRYKIETQSFYNYIQGKQNHIGKVLNLALNSPHDPIFHKFRSLNSRVTQLQSREFQEIKKVWNDFCAGVQRKNIAEIRNAYDELTGLFPMDFPRLKDFSDTDLIIFEAPNHGFQNGIERGEFDSSLSMYKDFVKCIRFEFSNYSWLEPEKFTNQVQRDLRKLMSLPSGRNIIKRILQKITPQTKIIIEPSDEFRYTRLPVTEQDPDDHLIEYSVDPTFTYQRTDDGLQSLSESPFSPLAHELLHLTHRLEGTFSHDINLLLNRRLYSDEEEWHVMEDTPCCSRHPAEPDNQKKISQEAGLPIRETHLAGSKPNESPDRVYTRALLVGAKKDAEHAFQKGVSSPVLTQTFNALSPETVHRFRLIAEENPQSRKGPFSSISTPPQMGSSSSSSSSDSDHPRVSKKRAADKPAEELNPLLLSSEKRRVIVSTKASTLKQ